MSGSRTVILGAAWLLAMATLWNIGPLADAEEQTPVPSASLLPSLAPTSPVVGGAPGLEPSGASNTAPPVLPVTQASPLSPHPASDAPPASGGSPDQAIPGTFLYLPGSAAAWSNNTSAGQLSIEKYLAPGASVAGDSAGGSATEVAAGAAAGVAGVAVEPSSPASPVQQGRADRDATAGGTWPADVLAWLENDPRAWKIVGGAAAGAVALVLAIVLLAVWRARRAGDLPAPMLVLPNVPPGAQGTRPRKRPAPTAEQPETPQQPARRAA